MAKSTSFIFNGNASPDEHGLALLKEAAGKGNPLRIQRLIAAGANLNVKGGGGYTALFHCIARNHDAAAVALIRAGADLSVRNDHGYSCLHMAAAWNRESIVRTLLSRNVPIDTKSQNGRTAMQIAEHKGYTDIVDVIRKAEERRARAIREGMPTMHQVTPMKRIDLSRKPPKPGKGD